MKIAVFGGAFNPVHIGHTALLSDFSDKIEFDKILIIPSKESPHKSSDDLISAKFRYDMCKIAFKDFENTEISDIEMKRDGKSYTVDTLIELKSIYPDDELFLICGSDMFLTLHDWREPVEIFKRAVICAAKRGDDNDEKIVQQSEMLQKLGAETVLINTFIPPVSSTNIRERLKNAEDCTDLLPNGVFDYIKTNGLYGVK